MAQEERETYIQYLHNEHVGTGISGVVDIGYSGTMQKKLSKLSESLLHGFYIATQSAAKDVKEAGMICTGYLFNDDNNLDGNRYRHPLNQYLPLMETLLSSTEGSFLKMTLREGMLIPHFLPLDAEEKRIALVHEIETGVDKYINHIVTNCSELLFEIKFSSTAIMNPLMTFFQEPSLKDAMLFDGVGLENSLGQSEPVMFIPNESDLEIDNLVSHKQAILKKYRWAEGTSLVIQKIIDRNNENIPKKKNLQQDKKSVHMRSKKMMKFLDKPDVYWDDFKIKPLRFLRHFTKKKSTRIKLCNLIERFQK